MKPLKTEKEADSSMKSTIRYTFVAPGAIGKGRGQGLKSLAERRDLSTKSFVSQSSDLVNEYMQEIETRKGRGQRLTNSSVLSSQGMTMIPKNSIDLEKENKQINCSAHASTNLGKGQGQGLTHSTLFTSQGMITIPKNSIDLEKENKQINPSAHASTNLGSTGKGRGQGLKSSTLCISQGMGMKYNNYMTSESELGCINKSALYANQHIKTPSISTRANLTMSSSQEMQRMDKSILEKEDMQTNLSLPPSIDQVMEHSQTTEKGWERWQSTDLAPIFFETRKKDNKLVEPKQLKSMYAWLNYCPLLRSTRDDNKFLNEENKSLNAENKSLNDRLSTLEDEMKEIMKMKELFAAQQSHVPPTISPASTE
ncbi:hypothetical protein H5410_056918 [Solanum commersonii]|uniref:Uncharacterized protein n=1 Tax=Solanum commersonii TaxID=4109 RepID=A0A9J5WP39_SOLCO|nr:hypothetical protein H5410_056918 [Solanum commersonii]